MSKSNKVFRNPLLYAMELRDRMLAEGISRAELARRLGVSRARVTQWLDLLELPELAIRKAEAMGDNWNRPSISPLAMSIASPVISPKASNERPPKVRW